MYNWQTQTRTHTQHRHIYWSSCQLIFSRSLLILRHWHLFWTNLIHWQRELSISYTTTRRSVWDLHNRGPKVYWSVTAILEMQFLGSGWFFQPQLVAHLAGSEGYSVPTVVASQPQRGNYSYQYSRSNSVETTGHTSSNICLFVFCCKFRKHHHSVELSLGILKEKE